MSLGVNAATYLQGAYPNKGVGLQSNERLTEAVVDVYPYLTFKQSLRLRRGVLPHIRGGFHLQQRVFSLVVQLLHR